MYDYDLIVIGGGSGGLVAARLARAFGAKVALIDKERLGGDCLRYGCVPSKTLIHIAKIAQQVRQGAERGVIAPVPAIQMPRVAATIAGVIDRIGTEEQVYVEGVEVRFGRARLIDPHTLDLDGARLTTRSVIIATGSRPAPLTLAGAAEVGYLTNEDAFDLTQLPASLAIIGGGPVGCELAQAFARLGSQVALFQRGARLLPKEEPDVSAAIQAALARDGVKVLTGTQIHSLQRAGDRRALSFQVDNGPALTLQVEQVLAAVGRVPNVEGLGLEEIGIKIGQPGIRVDDKLRTSVTNCFAIGDVTGGYRFTHVAASQAGIAVPNAFLPTVIARTMHYEVVPWVTFTDPEAARVGLTEAEARVQYGTEVRVVTFPWSHIDRAQTDGATEGFIKLILGKKDAILGAHLVGSHAGEILAEVALAMRHGLSISDITTTIHAYPTLATGLQQATFEAYLTSASFKSAAGIVQRFLPRR